MHVAAHQAQIQPRSWASALAAPRETVVEQLWRQDENGVYLVMIHSVDHPAVPEYEQPWYHWWSPVRAQVLLVHSLHFYCHEDPTGDSPDQVTAS